MAELDEQDGLTVRHPREYQGITLWCGDGMPLHIADYERPIGLRNRFSGSTIQRAVAIARLRAVADAIEAEEPSDDEW